MALGDGNQQLLVKQALRVASGKAAGDEVVAVEVVERLG